MSSAAREFGASAIRRRPTLAAVARAAGVAPSTASLVFSGTGPVAEATRDRVLATAAELGYDGPDPRARSLRRGRSGIVGVVLDDRLSDAFRDPVNVLTLDGIAEVAQAGGMSLLLVRAPLDEADGSGFGPLVDAPMDAVILIGCNVRVDPAVAVLRRRGIPVVAIEAEDIEGAVAIQLDNREGTRRASALLRDLGHERVAVVTLPIDASGLRRTITPEDERSASSFIAMERLRGVRGVFPGARAVSTLGSTVQEGRIAAEEFFGPSVPVDQRPTAIVAQSDLLAVGVISAALEAGLRVPEDVSVVGFDGIRVDDTLLHSSPIRSLTTLSQPIVQKGGAAARAALAMIDGSEVAPASFRSELRIGDTTAPPPGVPARQA
jgi:DNA-binding LacI/PurR family transcriptional regulator